MHDNPMAYTASFAVTALEEVFGEWLIIHGLWPPRSLDVNPAVITCGGYRKIVSMNNSQSSQEFKDNAHGGIADIST
jgi:hypothetical protein